MKQHKNGMVLLMVLVFMVISQLIFMGILHLNRINSLRYLTHTALPIPSRRNPCPTTDRPYPQRTKQSAVIKGTRHQLCQCHKSWNDI